MWKPLRQWDLILGEQWIVNGDSISAADLADILDTPTQYAANPPSQLYCNGLYLGIQLFFAFTLNHFCFHSGPIFLPNKIFDKHLALIISLCNLFVGTYNNYKKRSQQPTNSHYYYFIQTYFWLFWDNKTWHLTYINFLLQICPIKN